MSRSVEVNVVVVEVEGEVIERKVDVVVGSVKVLVASAICPSPPDDAEVLTDATSYAAKIICPCECIGAANMTAAAATLALDAYALPVRTCALQIGLMWPTLPQKEHDTSLYLQSLAA